MIDTAYDVSAEPDPDVFDPIAWYLATGEDLGVPADWLAEYQRVLAEELVKANEPPA